MTVSEIRVFLSGQDDKQVQKLTMLDCYGGLCASG